MNKYTFDKIIFSPDDVDLQFSPIRTQLNLQTDVMGAFNPGMTRLPNNNILLMVRIAEALNNPISDDYFNAIRWTLDQGFVLDKISLDELDTSDPRKYLLKNCHHKTYCLTSFSWLLPVELNEDGTQLVKIHYDNIIQPEKEYQEFGIEDARISKIANIYYMTACAVSSSRQSTILYSSKDGLNYKLLGVILDHQNKDMVLFPKKIQGMYYALTRPTGDHYFATNINNENMYGPTINMAQSPDLIHWKPVENFKIKLERDSLISLKNGGGAPPIETENGWLVLIHGVEQKGIVGIYRTFACLLERNNPTKILSINNNKSILESDSSLSKGFEIDNYVEDVVFTTGIEKHNDYFILASGELDIYCRITHLNKKLINWDKY